MKIRLRVEGPNGRHSEVVFDGYERITVGRAEDNDLQLDHDTVAPRHAELLVCDGAGAVRLVVTTDEMARCAEQRTAPADRVQIGAFTLRIVEAAAAAYPTDLRGYDVIERLATGGMAEVLLAEVRSSGERVAIKRILPSLSGAESFAAMFRDEGRIGTLLDHPNICRTHAWGETDGVPFIVMELIDGRTISQLLPHLDPARPDVAVHIIVQLCAALEYLHHVVDEDDEPAAIVHRGLSPADVMVDLGGAIKLIDFGIVHARCREAVTEPGVIKGRFRYMAPEVVRGQPLDSRADLFVTGVLLYELVTRQPAFVAETDFGMLEKIRNVEIVPVRQHVPDIGASVERVIERALQRDREKRFETAREMSEALQGAVADPEAARKLLASAVRMSN